MNRPVFDAEATAAARNLGDLPEWDLTDLYASDDSPELNRDLAWLATAGAEFAERYEGKLAAAQYWFAVELPRVPLLAGLCRTGEDSYARMRPEWF